MEPSDDTRKPGSRRQQLTKGMEHLRPYVIVPAVAPAPDTTPSPSSPSSTYGVPQTLEPVRKAAARPSDPSNKQKRTDPFQFGTRLLEEGDNIFEFNAWDHVETDAAYKEFSAAQYARQRDAPVSAFDRKRFNDDPAKWWNKFYANNTANFFKDRKWLQHEFPVLERICGEGSGEKVLLEVGAGAGNTAFPVLKMNRNPGLKIHACDFSRKAVELIKASPAYDERYIRADVWDVAAAGDASLPPGVQEGSVDVVMMVFIFSALAPEQWAQAVRNIWRVLKPGGQVFFRDYGRGDLAQVRFKKGRYMEENFYVRGDGTRVYFFEQEELENIWCGRCGDVVLERTEKQPDVADQVASLELGGEDVTAQVRNTTGDDTPAFEVVNFGVDRRMLVNRQRQLKMYRCWMQAIFRKPLPTTGTQDGMHQEKP